MASRDKSRHQTLGNSGINEVEDDASGDAKEQANDGQAFLPVPKEQADEAQQGAKSTQTQTDDVKNRHPADHQTDQGQDKASDAKAVLSFDDLIHYILPNTCRAQLLMV